MHIKAAGYITILERLPTENKLCSGMTSNISLYRTSVLSLPDYSIVVLQAVVFPSGDVNLVNESLAVY